MNVLAANGNVHTLYALIMPLSALVLLAVVLPSRWALVCSCGGLCAKGDKWEDFRNRWLIG